MMTNLQAIVKSIKTLEDLIPLLDDSGLGLLLMGATHIGTITMAALKTRGSSTQDILTTVLGVPPDVASDMIKRGEAFASQMTEGEEWKIGDEINPRVKPEWFDDSL